MPCLIQKVFKVQVFICRLGNPVCQCVSGYKPAPDTITGCERNDPCDPNPCGPGAECVPAGERATCKCPPGYKGDPFVSCRYNTLYLIIAKYSPFNKL